MSVDPEDLRDHALSVLRAYAPDEGRTLVANRDPRTGAVYDPDRHHLVATCRFAVNFAVCDRLDGPDWCLPAARRAVDRLLDDHRDPDRGGFHWVIDGTEPVDSRRRCYGHAFAVLALARSADHGVERAVDALPEARASLDRFRDGDLYATEYDPDWTTLDTYRGQNANMHACEALLAAHEATGDDAHLDRALDVARALTVDLASTTDGLVWEHYDADWTHDFAYNRDRPADRFRPWGYQPGHLAEWAKLLAELERHADADWLLDRARELFDAAVDLGWDDDHGGLVYTVDRSGEPVVTEKYGWPVAEAAGAAAWLHERTGDDGYRDWHDRCWRYALDHLVAPAGCWYDRLTREGEPVVPENPGPNVEPGYHPIGACLAGVRALG